MTLTKSGFQRESYFRARDRKTSLMLHNYSSPAAVGSSATKEEPSGEREDACPQSTQPERTCQCNNCRLAELLEIVTSNEIKRQQDPLSMSIDDYRAHLQKIQELRCLLRDAKLMEAIEEETREARALSLKYKAELDSIKANNDSTSSELSATSVSFGSDFEHTFDFTSGSTSTEASFLAPSSDLSKGKECSPSDDEVFYDASDSLGELK